MFAIGNLLSNGNGRWGFALAAVLLSGGLVRDAQAQNHCSATSWLAYQSCQRQIEADRWLALGNCRNNSDLNERFACIAQARDDFREAPRLCTSQRRARRDICRSVGQAAYDPQIDPEDFVDFEAVLGGEAFTRNPYYPIVPGSFREYLVSDADGQVIERVRVEILEETREIVGVQCIVVRDRVWEFNDDGEEEIIEDTLDWLAQNKTTHDVWYFGETVKDFDGGILFSVGGSFEHGQDSAKAGFWMVADPAPGRFYRQEFDLGNAEDVALVVSVGEETVTVPVGTYSDRVLKTKDSAPLDPGNFEFKYYAPEVELIMELNPATGEKLELVEIGTS